MGHVDLYRRCLSCARNMRQDLKCSGLDLDCDGETDEPGSLKCKTTTEIETAMDTGTQ